MLPISGERLIACSVSVCGCSCHLLFAVLRCVPSVVCVRCLLVDALRVPELEACGPACVCVLSLRVVLQCFAMAGAKGNQAKIPEPGSGTDVPLGCEPSVRGSFRGPTCRTRRGNATKPEDADGGFRKSFLFSRSGRGPGNLSEGDRVLAFNARSVSNTGRHRESPVTPLKTRVRGTRRCRAGSYPYPQQVSEVSSL